MSTCTRASTAIIASLAAVLLAAAPGAAKPRPAPYAPHIDPAEFVARVDHPYFPLVPGTRFVYRETAGGKTTTNEVSVLSDTKRIMGVTCTVVHDVVRDGDRVLEDTYDWYAQDKAGTVWYFGEDTKEFSPKGHASTEGSWEAGVGGAQPGIFMPADPTPGPAYRQEYSRGTAEDMGQIVAANQSVEVPAGTYAGCVRTKDWSLLEAGYDFKWYAKGVGFVRSQSAAREVSELISVTLP